MKTYFSFRIVFSFFFLSQGLLGALPGSFAPQQSGLNEKPAQLGQNVAARFGAWTSLGLVSLISAYVTYKTVQETVDAAMGSLPLFKDYHADTSHVMSLMATVPLSAIALMKLGPLAWYSFYMIYAGERMSPVLARNALRDLQVYVQHLHVIKAIQQDLFAIIDEINQAATVTTASTPNVQLPLEIPETLNKKQYDTPIIDPTVLVNLQEAIVHNQEYVHVILQQLLPFLPQEELSAFEQDIQIKSATVVYAIAYELQDQAQAIIDVLKMSEGQDMGDDAVVLNHLIKDLIMYWQSYTQSLADGIDSSVRFCNDVHLVEQLIVSWLDRSLLCV